MFVFRSWENFFHFLINLLQVKIFINESFINDAFIDESFIESLSMNRNLDGSSNFIFFLFLSKNVSAAVVKLFPFIGGLQRFLN